MKKFDFNNIDTKLKKIIIFGGIGLILLLVVICLAAVFTSTAKQSEQEVKTYVYTEVEQNLADSVKTYLTKYLTLSEQTSNEIADVAVQNYRTVMESDTDVINDDITNAVKKRIRSALIAFVDNSEKLSDDNLDALASGVTELIWTKVLNQISSNEFVLTKEFEEDYNMLTESLQSQIDDLRERKMKISINARVIDNAEADISREALIAGFDEMSDEDLQKLAEKMGISVEDITSLLKTKIDESNENIADDFEDELSALKKELKREISSSAGKTGATGKTGEQGEKGEQGSAGRDGADGKTTFIAYADDVNGTNFSLTPTESSKYIGTCITTSDTQPEDYASYSNWQEYRAYVITSTTDPDTGVTTVHIN